MNILKLIWTTSWCWF